MESNANFAMKKGFGVFELVDRLRRAEYIERMSIKHLTGWFVAAPAYEYKHKFGYHAWNHTEHTDWIRERLDLLRGGHADINIDPSLEQWIKMVMDAPNQYAFIRGSYIVMKKALLEFYKETVMKCDSSANAADLYLIKRIIPEIEDQVQWANAVLDLDPDPESSTKWAQFLEYMLIDIGGILCKNAQPITSNFQNDLLVPFTMPDSIIFDKRISNKPLMAHEKKLKLTFTESVTEQFRVFFNEVYAASMAATIVYESFDKNMSWGLIHDITRQFWDETRHSEFGAVRLKELGLAPDRCNQTLFKYSLSMPLINKLCYLTMMLEPHFMPRKKPRFREYTQAGDFRSQLFADHDWSDEINHVKYGKYWLDKLLENDARDIEKIKEETQEIINRIAGKRIDEMSPF